MNSKYNLEYYENMLRQYSATAEMISKKRWEWIAEFNPKTVLDYGSGVGWFRAWRPQGIIVDSFDIGQYPQTDISLIIYDVTCFWDVLEHIHDWNELDPVFALSKVVAGTIPIKPKDVLFSDWKHFKPGEHLHYWTEETLDALFKRYGFIKTKWGNPEWPPRKDVMSFAYTRSS